MKEEVLEKIVLHYPSGKTKVITEGLVLYTTNNDQDALAEFMNIDSKEKVSALSQALIHALKLAYDEFEKMEKDVVEHRQSGDIPSDK